MGYGYGTSDARGYVNARALREAGASLPRVTDRERREAVATAAAVMAGEYDSDDLDLIVRERDRERRRARAAGDAWDASLSERDPDAIRYTNGERYRETRG